MVTGYRKNVFDTCSFLLFTNRFNSLIILILADDLVYAGYCENLLFNCFSAVLTVALITFGRGINWR